VRVRVLHAEEEQPHVVAAVLEDVDRRMSVSGSNQL
jgi:hypothetical protein